MNETANVSQLIYVSRATQHVDRRELVDLVTAAASRNRVLGVTGALIYCDGLFLQILEGDADTLDALFAQIGRDVRHTDVQAIFRTEGASRQFAQWSMASLHDESMSSEQRDRAVRYTARLAKSIDDASLGHDARDLLADLRGAIARETSAACNAAA